MKQAVQRLQAWPRVVPAGRETGIALFPTELKALPRSGFRYKATITPCEGIGPEEKVAVPYRNGAFSLAASFPGEQEYFIAIEQKRGRQRLALGTCRIYSLKHDLFARRPFKGDLHLHSTMSDGNETPPMVVALSRRIGLDFMAVTDHHKYAPSIYARSAFKNITHDILIGHGEEIHPPGSTVHIVNFGGQSGINAKFAKNRLYRKEVEAIAAREGGRLRGTDRYQYASAVWCFRKIRETGGLGIFCHPYWFYGSRFDLATPVTDRLLRERPFDALELIGGFTRSEMRSNSLQIARYCDEVAKRGPMPVVGCSDAHSYRKDGTFGWYFSIVFSPSLDAESLIASIRENWSVAVEAIPGECPRPHGPFRLVKFADFLLREVFPEHDHLCETEGKLMESHLSGDTEAAMRLARLNGQTAVYLSRCWAQR